MSDACATHMQRWLLIALAAWCALPAAAAGFDLAQAEQSLDGWRLQRTQTLLDSAGARDDADTRYVAARLALTTYRHEAALRLAAQCMRLARSNAERSRCLQAEGEAIALQVALSGDDLGTLGLAGRLKSVLQRATQLDARNVRAQTLLARFYRVAPWLLGGSSGLANAQIGRAAAQAPQLADEFRGIDAFDAKDYARAVPLLQRAARATPQRAAPAYYLALALEQHGDTAAARAQLNDVVNRFPEFWEAVYRLGVNEATNSPQRSVALLRRFIASGCDPGTKRLAKSYRHLGEAEEKLGHPELAAAAYRQALRLKPGDNHAEKALQRLRAAS